MHHLGTVPINTRRLLLRPFTMEDVSAAFRNWCSDPQVTRYLRWPAHPTEEVTRMVLGDWCNSYADPAFYQWAIELKEAKEPIGSITVVHHDDRLGLVHIGYCIGQKWWGQGVTAEALAALIDFFFEQVGAQRIESLHDPNNPASGRVMLKCGMQQEGVLRKADWNNQGVVDACYHGLLREEWVARRG